MVIAKRLQNENFTLKRVLSMRFHGCVVQTSSKGEILCLCYSYVGLKPVWFLSKLAFLCLFWKLMLNFYQLFAVYCSASWIDTLFCFLGWPKPLHISIHIHCLQMNVEDEKPYIQIFLSCQMFYLIYHKVPFILTIFSILLHNHRSCHTIPSSRIPLHIGCNIAVFGFELFQSAELEQALAPKTWKDELLVLEEGFMMCLNFELVQRWHCDANCNESKCVLAVLFKNQNTLSFAVIQR